jgi:hypothetical protein
MGRFYDENNSMDRFYDERNMVRYRKLAGEAVTEMERTRLLGLLGKEMDEFTDLHKARAWRPTTRYGASIACPRPDRGD